jgi:hypothetical protein
MNKKLMAITLVVLWGVSASADDATSPNAGSSPTTTYSHSEDMKGRFGTGLILGEPTGVSLKYFLSDTIAIDGAAGWSFRDETDLSLHSDILWHKFDLVSLDKGQLPFYIGVGARVKFRENAEDEIGIRVPIGVSYIFDDLPLDVFFEVAPIVNFTPSTQGGFTTGIGARWWF